MTDLPKVTTSEELGLQAALLEQAEKRGFRTAEDRRKFMLRLAFNLETLVRQIRNEHGDAL